MKLKINLHITIVFLILVTSSALVGCASTTSVFSRSGSIFSFGRLIREPKSTSNYPPLEVVNTEEVRHFVKYYSTDGRSFIEDGLERRAKYEKEVASIFKAFELPEELMNVAFVESGFRPNVHSKSGAAGLWQFMGTTAKQFGLRVESHKDERKDVKKSTQAAAKYLKGLYDDFQDWHLVLAAYNAGPKHVQNAIRVGGSTNFFKIAKGSHLHRETREFVPKVLAVTYICKNLDRFGFLSGKEKKTT